MKDGAPYHMIPSRRRQWCPHQRNTKTDDSTTTICRCQRIIKEARPGLSFPGWSWAVGREFGRAGCKRKWIPSSRGTNIASAPCLVANQTVHFGWLTCSSAEVPCAQITRCSQGANILIWVMLLLLLLSTGPIDSICSSLSIPLFHHLHPLFHPPSLISACPVQGHENIYKKYYSLWGSPVLFCCLLLSQDKSTRAAVRLHRLLQAPS